MGGKDNQLVRIIHHCGVNLSDQSSYPYKLLVTFSISIESSRFWNSNYTDYQQYLFDRIKGYKQNHLIPIGYRKISQIFNEEGLKTPRGSTFKNNLFTPFTRKER